MPYAVIIIRANGEVEFSTQPKAPELAQSQEAVGGYIETISYFTKLTHQNVQYKRGTAYANEDGISKRLPLNRNATGAWRASCPAGDTTMMKLLGDVIFYAKIKE